MLFRVVMEVRPQAPTSFVTALHGHGMERKMLTCRGRKRDHECSSFLRAGIGLTDGCTDTLKWQWLLVDWNPEIGTPYSLCVSNRCVEGRCSLGRFEYKLQGLFFSIKKKQWYIWICWMWISELSVFKNPYLFIDSFQLCIWNQMVYSWTARLNILTFNVNSLTHRAVGYSYIFLHDLGDKEPLFDSYFFNAY